MSDPNLPGSFGPLTGIVPAGSDPRIPSGVRRGKFESPDVGTVKREQLSDEETVALEEGEEEERVVPKGRGKRAQVKQPPGQPKSKRSQSVGRERPGGEQKDQPRSGTPRRRGKEEEEPMDITDVNPKFDILRKKATPPSTGNQPMDPTALVEWFFQALETPGTDSERQARMLAWLTNGVLRNTGTVREIQKRLYEHKQQQSSRSMAEKAVTLVVPERLAIAERERDEAMEKMIGLEAEIKTLKSSQADAKRAKSEAAQRTDLLEKEKQQAVNAAAEYKRQADTSSGNYETAKVQLEAQRARADQKAKEARDASNELTKEREVSHALQTQLDSTQASLAEVTRVAAELKSNQPDVQAVQAKLERLEKATTSLQNQLRDTRDLVAKRDDELKSTKDALDQQVVKVQDTERGAQVAVADKDKLLTAAMQELSTLRHVNQLNQGADAQNKAERKRVEEGYEREKARLENDIIGLKGRVGDLEKEQRDYEAKKRDTADRMQRLTEDLARANALAIQAQAQRMDVSGDSPPPPERPRPTRPPPDAWVKLLDEPKPIVIQGSEPLEISPAEAEQIRAAHFDRLDQARKNVAGLLGTVLEGNPGDAATAVQRLEAMGAGGVVRAAVLRNGELLQRAAATGDSQFTKILDIPESADIHRMCADRVWGDVITQYMGDKYLMTGPSLANQVGWIRLKYDTWPKLSARLNACVNAWRWAHKMLRTESDINSGGLSPMVQEVLQHVMDRYAACKQATSSQVAPNTSSRTGIDGRVESLIKNQNTAQQMWQRIYNDPRLIRHWRYNASNPRDLLYPMADMLFKQNPRMFQIESAQEEEEEEPPAGGGLFLEEEPSASTAVVSAKLRARRPPRITSRAA